MIITLISKKRRHKFEFCTGDSTLLRKTKKDKFPPILMIYRDEKNMTVIVHPWKFKKYQHFCK